MTEESIKCHILENLAGIEAVEADDNTFLFHDPITGSIAASSVLFRDCVLNPTKRTFEQAQSFLLEAYDRAVGKFGERPPAG